MLAIGTLYLTDTGTIFLAINEEHSDAVAHEIGGYAILMTRIQGSSIQDPERFETIAECMDYLKGLRNET